MSDKTFEEIARETLRNYRPTFDDLINQKQVQNYYELGALQNRRIKIEPIIPAEDLHKGNMFGLKELPDLNSV